jgi:hypothetical protein
MRAIVTNFLRLEVLNHHPAVFWGVGAVWLLLIISAFLSVRSLPISFVAKLAWFLVIVVLPVLGLAAYALRCLAKANWKTFEPLFQSRRLNRQMSGDPVAKA